MTIRRINFYGGPGSGKSTAALYTAAKFKKLGYRAELAREFVKHWTYYKRIPTAWDQVHIFGQQIQEESILLENDIDIAIVECPLVVGVWYANTLNPELTSHLLEMARMFDEAFPAIHIYLDRGDLEFDPVGRFGAHNKDTIDAMDRSMYGFVSDYVGTKDLHVITSPFNPWELDNLLTQILVHNAGQK